jgi:hypothetical protein
MLPVWVPLQPRRQRITASDHIEKGTYIVRLLESEYLINGAFSLLLIAAVFNSFITIT